MLESTTIDSLRPSRSSTPPSTSGEQYRNSLSEEHPRFVASRSPPNFNPLRFCIPPSHTRQERQALIARAAYLRAERRGFRAGHDLEDWFAGEAEVDQQLAKARWRNDRPVWGPTGR